jgi:hypothetical protein
MLFGSPSAQLWQALSVNALTLPEPRAAARQTNV